ncbi:DUF4385 domain-containing protein [Chryseobacterium wangxinyae]|uniref:DUF4385 domain-containing protein n=1 Tax=Chryseobacterium sp. CY353 TaxID=2997334 RepID=UPI00226E6DC4|nr:DUF4385 domain-containing protein [Chryseobacterium sp. CY353]MCY0970465.1 DUF4385 domain-containing protein [Chryseobacterium sp. CY353]
MKDQEPSYLNFNKDDYFWKVYVDYRLHPEKYHVGKGEQGVLICEPYKTEIGKFWRFKSKEIAEESSAAIYSLFKKYLLENDFVGADMARKYLQMGFTRARRYYNYKGGKKYDAENNHQQLERGTGDPEKAESAAIFYEKWKKAEADPEYSKMKKNWKKEKG